MTPDQRERQAIEIAASAAIDAHLDHRNMMFLEACISAFLDVHTVEGVASILRDHADQLEAYG